MNCTSWYMPHLQRQDTSSNREYIFTMITSFLPLHMPFMWMPLNQYILPTNLKMPLILQSLDFTELPLPLLWILQITGWWHKNIPYGMPAIASLQFWTEDLNPVTLGRATESIYTTFFYTSTSHILCQQSDETLFGCFVIALNEAFN